MYGTFIHFPEWYILSFDFVANTTKRKIVLIEYIRNDLPYITNIKSSMKSIFAIKLNIDLTCINNQLWPHMDYQNYLRTGFDSDTANVITTRHQRVNLFSISDPIFFLYTFFGIHIYIYFVFLYRLTFIRVFRFLFW